MKTILVVPCFNEEARLPREAFLSFCAARPGTGILFIDDGSTDGTGAILRALSLSHPASIHVETLPANMGKGEAVRAGLRRALSMGPAFVGYWDADLSAPLEAVDVFEALLESKPSLEGVFGARIKCLGRRVNRRAFRHYVGRLFATLVGTLHLSSVYDTQCGAKLFRAGEVLRRCLEEPFLSRWAFDVELILRVLRASGRDAGDIFWEEPLAVWRDAGGSKVSLWQGLRAVLDLWRIR